MENLHIKQCLQIDVDSVIDRLLKSSTMRPNQFVLTEEQIFTMCYKFKEVVHSQPMLLELNPPIIVCGDVHGQYSDLKEILRTLGAPSDGKSYLFLGDYVDRGKQSLECICLLIAYKIRYQDRIFLLRGNHETPQLNMVYGFYEECKRRVSVKAWKAFSCIFQYLPVAAIVGDCIFCVHGGLSPNLKSLKQVNQLLRPLVISKNSIANDFLWSDPGEESGWTENHERGTSYYFGKDVISQFIEKNDLDLICRSHQIVENGYQFKANRRLVTIFSCPNYCARYDNYGAVLNIGADMSCHIVQFQREKTIKKKRIPRQTPEAFSNEQSGKNGLILSKVPKNMPSQPTDKKIAADAQ